MGDPKNTMDIVYGNPEPFKSNALTQAGSVTTITFSAPARKGFIAIGGADDGGTAVTGSVIVKLNMGNGYPTTGFVIDQNESFPLDGLNVTAIQIQTNGAVTARYRIVGFPQSAA